MNIATVRRGSELSFIFFFQAEDGIRDDLVTGVQTCALPISEAAVPRTCAPRGEAATAGRRTNCFGRGPLGWGLLSLVHRSEERRVGKECRSRRSPYH